MEDDILTKLMDLAKNKPPATGFGGTSFGMEVPDVEIGKKDSTMFIPEDTVTPEVKPKKVAREKKLVVVIDDDFSTTDLMKIYLQRDYEYVAFDDPKNAIFYLNANIPDLIFIDSYLILMKTKRVIEIIRTYKELAKVPIVYLADEYELSALESKIPEGVVDIITRPVKRGDLQRILDTYIVDSEESSDDEVIDHPIV